MGEVYSEFIFLRDIDKSEEIFEEVVSKWKEGIKVYFCTDKEKCLDEFKEYIKSNLGYLEKYRDFKIKDNIVFNLALFTYNINLKESFFIKDGNLQERYREILKKIGENTTFNLQQYMIEHEKLDKDILCIAKAGTGKTYSMIARVTFLIRKKGYDINEIRKKIYIITFTNEATFVMKTRLKEYYKNLYLLTKDLKYLEVIEEVERMQISTIHSILKKIIDKLSTKLGIGYSPKIYSGKDEINKVILDRLNEYYKENGNIGDKNYNIESGVRDILSKLEEKNIRIGEGFELGFGLNLSSKVINNIIIKVQEDIIKNSKTISSVRLKEHVIFVLEIIENYKWQVQRELNIDYLFIDEFQDTDSMQIKVLNEMKEILNFKTFIVGDTTQAIYRFRGANDTAFNEIRRESFNLSEYTLIKNYRTDKRVLNEINKIFKSARRYIDYDTEIIGTKEIVNSTFIKERDLIPLIEKLLENKRETTAILVRNNYEVNWVRELLRDKKIYIKTTSSENLYKKKATVDFYKLVLALKFNKDPKYLFNLEDTNYVTGLSDKVKLFNMKTRDEKLRYFKELNLIKGFDNFVEDLEKELVLKVLRDIIKFKKPWELEDNCVEYKNDLDHLFAVIIDRYDGEYLTLSKVCKFLELAIVTGMNEDTIEPNSTSNIVCSTVHKVKGLEFD